MTCMKIDEVIRKCMEVPGISMKCGEYSSELILKTSEGKGSMTFFPLLPGLTLAYIFVNSPTWTAPNLGSDRPVDKGPLLLNYCVTGRCEMILNNENFVYVKDGEISLTERFTQKQYVYPRRIYEGMEFFIDLESLSSRCPWLLTEFGIDFERLTAMYCPDGRTYISTVTRETEEILNKLWGLLDLPLPYGVMQMKVYAVALFSVLLNLREIPASQACTFFTESQVNIAKRVEQIISSDLRQHHPAWELAQEFSISETSLKNYFRGVYGQNISVYLKELRMKKAAELLADTRLSVAEVAELVGYVNQSKFAAVFKKVWGMSPLEFRRVKRLGNA